MHPANEDGYKPPPELELDTMQPLIDINVNDNTEFWLIQWPLNQFPEIDGRELKLELHQDGQFSSVEDSSGKAYDLVSSAAQEADAVVIVPSGSESKIVGRISRRVSLVRYPEPDELEKLSSKKHQRPTGTFLTNSSHYLSTPTQSNWLRSSQSARGDPASTHSSKHRSSISGVSEKSKPLKRKLVSEPSGSMGRSALESGQGHSSVTFSGGSSGRVHSSTTTVSGSSEPDHQGKLKKKRRIE